MFRRRWRRRFSFPFSLKCPRSGLYCFPLRVDDKNRAEVWTVSANREVKLAQVSSPRNYVRQHSLCKSIINFSKSHSYCFDSQFTVAIWTLSICLSVCFRYHGYENLMYTYWHRKTLSSRAINALPLYIPRTQVIGISK